MKVFALRLKPDQDLRQSLKEFALLNNIQAGFVLSAIGSLKQAAIRFADQPNSKILQERSEILSLNGTLSINGIHLHILVADSTGKVIGGHLNDGNLIYTTAEIVIGESEDLVFLRTPDERTGFLELEIKSNPIGESDLAVD